MTRFCVTICFSLLAMGAIGDAANAHSRCDGDFELINGSWIATPHCQEAVAEAVARERHMHVSERPSRANEWTPEEFCRWAGDSRTSTYCLNYVD
jgi:hypothetical protein